MSLISDLLHPGLSAVAHCPSSSDFMDPNVLKMSPLKYGDAYSKNCTRQNTDKKAPGHFLQAKNYFGDGIKYKVVFEERLRLI